MCVRDVFWILQKDVMFFSSKYKAVVFQWNLMELSKYVETTRWRLTKEQRLTHTHSCWLTTYLPRLEETKSSAILWRHPSQLHGSEIAFTLYLMSKLRMAISHDKNLQKSLNNWTLHRQILIVLPKCCYLFLYIFSFQKFRWGHTHLPYRVEMPFQVMDRLNNSVQTEVAYLQWTEYIL